MVVMTRVTTVMLTLGICVGARPVMSAVVVVVTRVAALAPVSLLDEKMLKPDKPEVSVLSDNLGD